MAQAERLARVTGLDMVASGWRPTTANYFGRVTKARIVEAVREGAGERAAQLIDHMKKGDMAKEGPKAGQRAVNGWKNAGLPWSYKLDKAKMYFPK
jgi:ParB family chromosome partitioning protein